MPTPKGWEKEYEHPVTQVETGDNVAYWVNKGVHMPTLREQYRKGLSTDRDQEKIDQAREQIEEIRGTTEDMLIQPIIRIEKFQFDDSNRTGYEAWISAPFYHRSLQLFMYTDNYQDIKQRVVQFMRQVPDVSEEDMEMIDYGGIGEKPPKPEINRHIGTRYRAVVWHKIRQRKYSNVEDKEFY